MARTELEEEADWRSMYMMVQQLALNFLHEGLCPSPLKLKGKEKGVSEVCYGESTLARQDE